MGKHSAALVDTIVDPDNPVFEYTLSTRKGGETALTQRFNSFGLTWKSRQEFSHRMHFWKLQRSFDGMTVRAYGLDKGVNTNEEETFESVGDVNDHGKSTLRSQRDEDPADYWDTIVKLYAVNGILTPLFLLSVEEFEILEIHNTDLMIYQTSKWDGDIKKIIESKKDHFVKEDVEETLRDVGEKLIQNHQNLVGRLGEEKLGNLIERNRRILSGIEPGTNVTRLRAKQGYHFQRIKQ